MRFNYPGGDPRRFNEFETLRSEIGKLSQTTRPPLDWAQIDVCARSLFEQNGVDLLSACYFSLARTHIHGLRGFVESCELISALICQHWDDAFWPPEPQARIDALDWFNVRTGHLIRRQSFSIEQLSLLKRAEKALENIADKLQQVPLKKLSRIENLFYFVQNVVDTLEKPHPGLERAISIPPPSPRPPLAQPKVHPSPSRERGHWRFFGLGALCSAIVASLFYYIQVQHQNAVAKVVGPSLEWFSLEKPSVPDDVLLTGHSRRIQQEDIVILAQYRQQLNSLTHFSPRSSWIYGENLVRTSQEWWPDLQTQHQLEDFWAQYLNTQAAYPVTIDGYYQIQGLLSELITQLDKASRQDKYITVTYLRTMLQRMQAVQQNNVPVEEWLRKAEELKKKGLPLTPEIQRQLDQQLKTISARYYLAGTDRRDTE
ncbi:hypothetical protein [Metakosakonia massiliensis]|uniref:ImpA domain protein n=1 Tax=Phytobacter massiliensis TaxID=1485952 RepID=A0A6N3AHK9_9ENTR|nr:VasL domain-containing protein [Phytobacter massiliensis]